MKKFLIALLILGVVLLAIFLLMRSSRTQQQQVAQEPVPTETESKQKVTDFPEPPPGAIVFNLKYRGLSGEKDELRYNSFWGFGGSENETPFLADLKKNVKDFEAVYNPFFIGAEWSAVEIKDNKVVALYIDLDANGKVSNNEKILPIQNPESSSYDRTEFVTPDFIMNTRDNRQVPFRALLQATFYGQPRPQFMWSPSCILEGISTFYGRPTKLILFANGFTGDFDQFGSCSYSLQDSDEPSGRYISRNTLSSIINYKEQFYNLKLSGSYEKDKKIQVKVEKYVGATGELAIQLKGDTNLETRLSNVGITGVNDKTIRLRFNVPSGQTKLPVGIYKLCDGHINYGVKKANEWRLDFDFKDEPEFTVDADKTCKVELGKPVLSVSAVEENKRYQSDVKEQTVYSEGTNVYISRIIKGKAGELYGRFSQKQQNSGYTDIEPELKIVDSEGKEVAATKIKYG